MICLCLSLVQNQRCNKRLYNIFKTMLSPISLYEIALLLLQLIIEGLHNFFIHHG